MSAVERLRARVAEIVDLKHSADLIEWDERVYMPLNSVTVHGEMSATLRRLAHEKFTSAELGKVIADAQREASGEPPDSDTARMVAVTARDYDKATRVPPAFVAEHAVAVSAAQHAWAQARAAADFSLFQPHLQKVIDLKRQYVAFFPPADHPYDVLLDDYEPGLKTADVKRLFAALRPRQVKLIRELADRPLRRRRFSARRTANPTCGALPSTSSARSASTGRADGRTSRCIRLRWASAATTSASRRAGWKGSRYRCCSGRCTKRGMLSTSRE